MPRGPKGEKRPAEFSNGLTYRLPRPDWWRKLPRPLAQ
jgi:hypothetical protein